MPRPGIHRWFWPKEVGVMFFRLSPLETPAPSPIFSSPHSSTLLSPYLENTRDTNFLFNLEVFKLFLFVVTVLFYFRIRIHPNRIVFDVLSTVDGGETVLPLGWHCTKVLLCSENNRPRSRSECNEQSERTTVEELGI